MATNPTIPVGQTKTEDPWKNITARDVLLDPAFHQLPSSTRKLILSKVWPDFSKASPTDQDATIGVKYDDWLSQAQATAPKEPGIFEKSWGKLKDTIGHVSEQIGEVVPAVGQKAKDAFQKIPDWTDKAAESIYKSKVGLQDVAAQRKPPPLEPPPGIPAPSEAFLKLAAEQPTRQPAKKTAEQYFSEKLPPPPAQPGPKPKGIDALGAEISDLNGKLEQQVLDLRKKWPTGPDLKSKAAVDEFNARVGEINANLAIAKEKSKKYMDFSEAASFAGKRGVSPQDPNLALTMARITHPGAPEIGPMSAGDAERFREETQKFESTFAQVPLAEKILASVMQGVASGVTFGAFELQEGETGIEKLAAEAGSLAGIGPSFGFAGAVATPVLGALRKIPIAGKWWGNLEKISKASVALKRSAQASTPASAEIAAKTIGKLADDIPEFEKALQFALQHPKLSEAATGVVQGVQAGTVMAAAGTIAAVANGQSPKDALLHGFGVAVAGELLRAAPGIRGLADKMKLDLTNPKLSQMATALQGKAGAIPAAERERIAFKQFMNEFMGRPQEEAIGRAFQSAVAYGVASAGVTAVLTPGDVATRLKIGGESGFRTFIAIGAMHLPSVLSAIRARVGRPVEPAEAAIAYNNMTRDEKRELVASIAPEDLTKAADNVNRMSGEEGVKLVKEDLSRQPAPAMTPTEVAAPTTPTAGLPSPPAGAPRLPAPPEPAVPDVPRQFVIAQRVITPDGAGEITAIQKTEGDRNVAVVRLDSGEDNSYPTPMLDLEPGQEMLSDKPGIPESTDSLRAQVDSLVDGQRSAVVLPPNISSKDFTKVTERLDHRWGRVDNLQKGTAFYDPSKISREEVQQALDTGNEHLLMGAAEPLSDKTTAEIKVVGSDGVDIDVHKVSPEKAQEEAATLAKTAPKGATVEIRQDDDLKVSQEIDSNVGLPELAAPPRSLNPENKVATGLGLLQEDYLTADPHIPKDVMPGSGEEDGYVYGVKQALADKELIDPGLGGSFMAAAGKGFAAARRPAEEAAPVAEPGPIQSWKVEVKTPGEEEWMNVPVRFGSEKEAKAYATDLGKRLFSNSEYRTLGSPDPVRHVWDPEQARAIDIAGAPPPGKMAPPPDNSLYIYSPFGVLPRETGGDIEEETADRAIDFHDRRLEELERENPKAIQTEEYQQIKRDRDEIAWGRMPAVPFGRGAWHRPVLTLREWPADTPSPRMIERAGEKEVYTKEQIERYVQAKKKELATEEAYDRALTTTEEDVVTAIYKMFGNDEFVSKFIDANNNYPAFHKAMTSGSRYQKEVTLDLPDQTKLDILAVFGPHPQIFVERYKFEAGRTKLIDKTGKSLTQAVFNFFSQKMREASAPKEGQIALVQDQLDALKKAIEQVKKGLPTGAPVLDEVQLLRDYRVGHLTVDPKTETGVTFLRALVAHLSTSADASDRYTSKVIQDHAPKIFTADRIEQPEPQRPAPRSVADLHLVAVRWANEYGIEGADVWVYKDKEDALAAVKRIGTSVKTKDLLSQTAPKGWTEDDIRRTLRNRWAVSKVEIMFDGGSETAEAEKTPAPAQSPPGNPWEGRMPQGVNYEGPQDAGDGTWIHIYTDQQTGSSIGLKEEDSLIEKVGAVRQKFAQAQRDAAVAREGTDHPRMPKPPFSYSRDLPNDTDQDPQVMRMQVASVETLQKQGGLADKVIQLAIAGMDTPQTVTELLKFMPSGKNKSVVRLQILAVKALKGIPENVVARKNWVEKAVEIMDGYNREIPTAPEEIPAEKPVDTWKKAHIVPTREGVKAIPIPDNLAPPPQETKSVPGKSWKYEVMVQGKWSSNSVAFATKEEADSAGFAKQSNWVLVDQYRVVESDDKVNYRFDRATGDLRAVDEPPEELEPPEPIAAPKNAEADAAREKLRKFLKQKRGGEAKPYAMAIEEEPEISPEELMGNMDVIEALVTLGEQYHATGASKEAWHSSMWHEAEDIEEGFGDIVEKIFPMIWQSVTGESDYAGGSGGVYGAGGGAQRGAKAGDVAGMQVPGGPAGELHGGLQPKTPGELGEVEGTAGLPAETGAALLEDIQPKPGQRPDRNPSEGIGGVGVVPGTGSKPRDDGRFYRLTREDHFGQGTSGQKIEANLEAIRTLVELRQSGEPATETQKQKLAKYVGWGAFQTVFDDNTRFQNSKAYEELRDLLSSEEWARARASTMHAFYTDFDIAESMWYIVDQLGFRGNGTVAEPALGNGVFFGTAPDHVANTSSFLATELDLITAEIAKHLYPAAKIFAQGYEKLEFPDGTIDLYISNPPFGGTIYDRRYPDSVRSAIHDYFFIKSLDKLREGGILIFVTSQYTMDKTATSVRQLMMDRADLVTAIRLPNNAFMDNAGTKVTTDIVVLKKRSAGDDASGESFLHTIEIEKALKINEFFARHPENMLGKMTMGPGLYSANEPVCLPFGDPAKIKAPQIAQMIRAIADKLPADIYKEDIENKGLRAINFAERFAPGNVWEGQIIVDPETNKLMRNRNGSMGPIEEELIQAPSNEKYIRDLISIRDSLWSLFRIQLETENDEVIEEPRKILNQIYDQFTEKHERLDNKKTKVLFGEDPTYFYLTALENLTKDMKVVKSDIFFRRTMRPQMNLVALPPNTRDALLMIYAHKGFADLDLMAKLSGKAVSELEKDLREQKYLFKDPQTGKLELPEQYLSGDVVSKWEVAVNAVSYDPSFQVNADALRESWPEPVLISGGKLGDDGKPIEIETRLGAPWIKTNYYEDFAKHLFGEDIYVEVTRNASGKWNIDWKQPGRQYGWQRRRSEVADSLNHGTWGTRYYGAKDLILDGLNQQRPTVTREDPVTGQREKDKPETMAALRAQLKIFDEFDRWAKTGPHAQQLQDDYNYSFNRIRLREYNGHHLTFDGMSLDILRRKDLDPHQKNAVWRIIMEGRGLLAHGVGLGKAQPLDAKILTPTGWRRMGDINPGDEVIGVDGRPCKIISVHPQGIKDIYRIRFSDGAQTECCNDHIWLTQNYNERNKTGQAKKLGKRWKCAEPKLRTLSEIRSSLRSPHLGAKNHSIPLVAAVEFEARSVIIDPYILGVILGDGGITTPHITITSEDDEIIEKCKGKLPEDLKLNQLSTPDRARTWSITQRKQSGFGTDKSRSSYIDALDALGLLGHKSTQKFVPDLYKFNSIDVRLQVLQGILDTDGWVQKFNSICYYSSSPRLLEDVIFLVQSLGGVAHREKGERICISLPNHIAPFTLGRKAKNLAPKVKYYPMRYVVDVEFVGQKEAQCILVDHPQHLYITDDFLVTHNTFTMVASAMEMKRMGIAQKSLFAAPKNVVPQFANDFARLYPGAKILCPTEKDFSAQNRKKLFARMAVEDWDGIIISHEQLQKIPISPDRLAMTINEELWALEQTRLSLDETDDGSRRHRMNVKRIEKAIMEKTAILEELSDLAKDQTIFFDHMGVDYLYVDEAHKYKNLGVSTKMGGVAGLTTTGNKISLDLKAKVDFIIYRGRGRGIILSTGTPVSNSMTELYTMTRYVAPELLRNSGIKIFDDWAANFGSVGIEWELGPDGRTYKQKVAFSEFTNLSSLGQMFRTFSDVAMKEDVDLPIPRVLNDGPTVIELPMVDEAKPYFDSFTLRSQALERGNVDKTIDNWLKLTGDAKRASLDLRLLDAGAPDIPESKLNTAIRALAEYYVRHGRQLRTQIVFSEFKRFANGTSLYGEMKRKLVELGVKADDIAIIHDYKRDDYAKLYDDMNEGKIRVLLTTRKTAEGANMQERLGRLYHLDAAWTPKDMEQREGRIVRQGNLHYDWDEPVEIIQYLTKYSYDSVLFNILRRKSAFIRAYLKGDTNVRAMRDPSAKVVLNYELMSVLASGNPDALTKIQLENSVADLEGERETYLHKIRNLRASIESAEVSIPRSSANLVKWRQVLETYLANREPFSITIDDRNFSDPDDAVDFIRKMKDVGRTNPEIEKLIKAGKDVPAEMPKTVPYQPKINARYLSFEGAIEKINTESDSENRKILFTATIAGETLADRGKATEALKELIKRNDVPVGMFKIDITLFNVPVQVTVDKHINWYRGPGATKDEEVLRVHLYYTIANESFETTDVEAIFGSAENRFRNSPERIAATEEDIQARTKDLENLKVEINRPWDGDEELRTKRQDLAEINQKLGLTGERTAEDADPDDIADAEIDDEESIGDEGEYSDRYYSIMDSYNHIPKLSPDELRMRARSYEPPTGDRSEGGRIEEARRQLEVPELEPEEELGPAFMFEVAAEAETIASLDAGKMPDTLREKLRLSGRVLTEHVKIAKFKTGRYEISDGASILSVYTNENGGLEVWDPTAFGRIEIPELIWMIEQITKNPLKMTMKLRRAVGHFMPAGEGGYVAIRPELAYDPKNHEVLARTIAHELGHAIDFQPDFDMTRGNLIGRILSLHKFLKQTHGDLKGLRNKELKNDLTKLSDFWRPWERELASSNFKKYRASAVELYADFISAVLLSPGTAEAMAPAFYRVFHRKLDLKPKVKEEYFKMRLMMQGTREEMLNHRLMRLGAMLRSAEEISVAIMLEKQLKANRWGQIRADYDDMRWDIKQRARKAIRAGVLSWDDAANPLTKWDEFPLKVRTDMYRHSEKVMKEVIDPLTKLGLDFHDLGGFMQLNRSATERENMMNPIFGPGKYAVETLDQLRKVLGDEKYKALEEAAARYHDIRWHWVEEGLNSGIYSQEVFDNKFLPNKYYYGKFTPLEYLDQYVSPTVKSQIGYAGPIANTFIETLKMDMSLIRLVALNDAKSGSIKFLKEFYPGEVKFASVVNPGDKIKQFKRAPKGFDIVEIMSNGTTVGYYVDKYIAESLNTVSPDAARGLTEYAQKFNSKFYWPLVILYNMGFSGWGNPWRDFWTNWTKLPLKTAVVGDFYQLLKAYRRAAPHAWAWIKGREDQVTKMMIDSYAYSMPLSDLVTDERDSLNLVLKKSGFIRDIREIHKGVAGKAFGAINKITKFMEMALSFSEMTGKVAGYYVRRDAGEQGKELAFNIRNYTSTPNFDVKGHKTKTTNSWFPFSNIIKEGWKSTYLTATDPGTRSGFWFRTSKLLGLVMLTIAAELGFLGSDLEKFYGSISRYLKNNYFCLGWGPPDEQGRVTVLTLPKDEGTRFLGAILRETMIMMRDKDPEAFIEEIGKFIFSQTPSLTPLLKVPVVNALWFATHYNFPDTFRMTPILPETIAKAEGLPAAERMLLWSINEIGIGQFTTWDDSKRTFYQWWTQTDPTVGRLLGRMFRVTSYGITEQQRTEVDRIEKERARQSIERRELPAVSELYSLNYKATMANTLLKAAISKGMSRENALLEYPDAVTSRVLSSAIQRISRMQKSMNTIKEDRNLSDEQKKARGALISKQMEEFASQVITSVKNKGRVAYPGLPEPPGVNEGLMPPPGVVRKFPGLPEPPR